MNNLDYQNLNSLRNYPIKDGASRVSEDGLFTIPNTLIVDIVLASPGHDLLDLYISKINVNGTYLHIEVSAAALGVFGTFGVVLPNIGYNFDITLTPSTLFPEARGLMTVGTTSDLASQPYGEFTFTVSSTPLLMRVYGPSAPGVNWISFLDTKGNQTTLTGYVKITANSNIQFRNPDTGVIFLDAGEALGLNKNCDSNKVPITSINGVPGDTSGNFTLIPEQCVQLTPAPYGLLISDTCGQPCMGCTEINTLTTAVNGLEASIVDMRNFINRLQSAVTQAQQLINFQCQCE